MPSPLDYVLAATIPFVLPAIPLALGGFTYQRIASAIRIRQHLKDSAKEAPSSPPIAVSQRYLLKEDDGELHGVSFQSNQ